MTYLNDFCPSLCFSDDSTDMLEVEGELGVDDGIFERIGEGCNNLLLLSFQCKINCTSFEYSPHLISI